MKRLISILTIHSVRELFRYKSFLFLIFVLFFLDRGLKKYAGPHTALPDFGKLKTFGMEAARFLFEDFLSLIKSILLTPETVMVLFLLFIGKQIISLWPSSDMRRMHRHERKGFGIFASLKAIRINQVLWDALAVGSICCVVFGWMGTWFFVLRYFWFQSPSVFWLGLFIMAGFMVFPIAMAGFSYSSKLAVLSKGSFREKLSLYFKLFTDRRIFLWSWAFYAARIVVETVFVAAIPVFVMVTMENFWLRMAISGLSATPVYAYLKMASFKFFLITYEPYPLVKEEYASYFSSIV